MTPPAAEASREQVILVTALLAEAKPLIEHFGLTPAGDGRPFRVFTDRRSSRALIVAGTGRVAAGAAVAHLGRRGAGAGWLNVGIAGHADHPPGTTLLAHSIHEQASGRSWYPPLIFEPPCPTAAVRTVDRPCTDFPDDALYDMEASGFYGIAGRYSSHELVHCVKVVSDNRDQPADRLTANRVTELMAVSLEPLSHVVDQLTTLVACEQQRLREPPGFEDILRTAHFSVTRRRQLRRLLRRWAALLPETDAAAWLADRRPGDAADALAALEHHLDRPPRLRKPA